MNPYNCTLPGNLFVGYEDLRNEVRMDLRDGKSFAVLGGRRCGKTSLLLELEKDLNRWGLAPFEVLPRFIDLQGLGALTTRRLFKTIYQQVVQEIDAKLWEAGEEDSAYEDFLCHLDAAQPRLREHYGPDWVVVLLVDELDSAIAKLPGDQFFQNLRNLLMVSRHHRSFRLVASGVKEMSRLISSGSSPLNNLAHIYLRILWPEETSQLIAHGFPPGLDPEIQAYVLELTGGHPYLMQGLLEKLRKETRSPTRSAVDEAKREFLREHKEFRRWFDGFSPAERALYQLIIEAPDRRLNESELRGRLARSMLPEAEEALTVLSFHGVIDDSSPTEIRAAGTMFDSWWRQNAGLEGPLSQIKAELMASLFPDKETDKKAGWPSISAAEQAQETIKAPLPANDTLPIIPDHAIIGRQPFARGAYGQVWLAQTVIGTFRAVKVVYRYSFSAAQPFEREFRGIKNYEPLSRAHAGLVQVLHVGRSETAGYFYYVMELGDDETLGQAINPGHYAPRNLAADLKSKGKIPVSECVQLGLSLANALGFLHQNNLVHRDVKPSNIIFVKGVPKLADIGLVTVMAGQSEDKASSWVGTEGYFPPEGPGTTAGDFYALGKVLYQACTGYACQRFPELPEDMLETGTVQLHGRFLNIIMKACHLDDAKRYQTSGQISEDLRRLTG